MTHSLITLLFAVLCSKLVFEQVIEDSKTSTKSDVELTLSNIENGFSWGSQIRYVIEVNENIKGLTLMGRSSCFGCHADKSTMIGPSFADMANAYYHDEEGVNKLVNSIRHGSTGVWGEAEMPAHPDISEKEAADIVEYILTQGGQKYSWVYRGLEGIFQVIDQPQQIEKGSYILIASYTSSEERRGVDRKILNIE